jgi:hypothetical protein
MCGTTIKDKNNTKITKSAKMQDTISCTISPITPKEGPSDTANEPTGRLALRDEQFLCHKIDMAVAKMAQLKEEMLCFTILLDQMRQEIIEGKKSVKLKIRTKYISGEFLRGALSDAGFGFALVAIDDPSHPAGVESPSRLAVRDESSYQDFCLVRKYDFANLALATLMNSIDNGPYNLIEICF